MASQRINAPEWTVFGQRLHRCALTRILCARILMYVNVTLLIDDTVMQGASGRGESQGTSVNQVIRD